MSSERHQRLKELFLAAVELRPDQLDHFLATTCGDDTVLAGEVRSLLVAEARAGNALEHPSLPKAVLSDLERDLGTTPESDATPPQLDGWERYTLLERIGSGGMGEVYKAWDPRLKRFVALKFLHATSGRDVQRFLREAEAQARVEHSNVLEVYETGEVAGRLFIAMRYVDGPTLLGTRQETTLEQKVELMRQVADAIQAAHRQGLIHRDVKPGNILVERSPEGMLRAYVADFGIAADLSSPGLTATGEMLGTPWYMAPERLTGGPERLDRRTDVFSLGVTMYEYLCGERPVEATTPIEMMTRLRDGDVRPLRRLAPELPQDLETVVMKCLELDPQRRYASARALAEDLERYLDGEPITARRPTLTYRLFKRLRRNPALVTVSVLALAALLVLAGTSLRLTRQARLREELARDFSRRVVEIELVVRMAHMAPLHDIRREKEQARELMAGVTQRLEATGLLAEGSGHYALGRGFLALGELRRAREQLERAWALGYRDPGLAAVLGRVLGELYTAERRQAERIFDPDLRATRQGELDRELRLPALAHLRTGRSVREETPEYLEALIASLEGRPDDARHLAERAWTRLPWLYEAKTLTAEVFVVQGFDQWRQGDAAAALAAWKRAASTYQAAAATGRSDPGVHLGVCRLAQVMMEAGKATDSADAEASFWLGSKACDRALYSDSSLIEVYRARSDLHRAMADLQATTGGQPESYLDSALESARSALELRSDDPLSLITLGNTWLSRRRDRLSRGEDASGAEAEVKAAYRRALGVDQKLVEGLGDPAAIALLAEISTRPEPRNPQ